MKVEAHLVILMKRVYQLEHIVDRLITIVESQRNQLSFEPIKTQLENRADKAALQIFDAGAPFDPSCSNCKHELRVINDGTEWESFHCPNCEAWYFPSHH